MCFCEDGVAMFVFCSGINHVLGRCRQAASNNVRNFAKFNFFFHMFYSVSLRKPLVILSHRFYLDA